MLSLEAVIEKINRNNCILEVNYYLCSCNLIKNIRQKRNNKMKESITDRYIGIGTSVGVAIGLILKIALDSLVGLALGIFLGVFGGCMAAVIKRMSQKSNTDKKKLEFYFLCGCVLGVVLGILGMVYYLITNG